MENKKLRLEILRAIEKNSKLSAEDLGAMLGVSPEQITAEIKALEAERIICGYPTFVDWDKIDDTETYLQVRGSVLCVSYVCGL